MSQRLPRLLLFATVAFVLGLLAARALQPSTGRPQLERATYLPDAPPLAPFALVGQDGKPLGRDAFRGHWTYVFFGFTACPDICPTTMGTLAAERRLLHDLPPDLQPQVLMVSVDPARDDAAKLGAYVRYFDPSFTAATGNEAAIASTAAAFGAAYTRVPTPDGGYTVDHSAGLFLVGPRGNLVATSSAPHDAAVMARDYRAIVAADRRIRR